MAWFWFVLFAISVGVNIGLFLRPDAIIHAWEWVDWALVKLINRKSMWLLLLTLTVAGCDVPVRVQALPMPRPEQPPANLPAELHQRNWTGPLGQGSCVHASLTNHLRWLNEITLAQQWKNTYSDGEWESRLRARLDAADIDYGYTVKADPRFLDWASQTRRGAICWWKPSHCCTFMGWVARDGRQYAAILDNNYPGHFELTEREQFIRLWAGYGGFALSVMSDPTSSLPWRSYEVVQ